MVLSLKQNGSLKKNKQELNNKLKYFQRNLVFVLYLRIIPEIDALLLSYLYQTVTIKLTTTFCTTEVLKLTCKNVH